MDKSSNPATGKRMRRVFLGLTCAVLVAGVATWVIRPGLTRSGKDPIPEVLPSNKIVVDTTWLADAGVLLAIDHTGDIRNPRSLQDLRGAIEQRGPVTLALLQAELAALERSPAPHSLSVAHKQFQIST